jgi:hypothetical protein
MNYLENLLKFVIQRCQVNMRDAHVLIKTCENDCESCDEKLPIIVYGNLLRLNEDYKPVIRFIVKEVYMDNAPSVLTQIYTFAYRNN